MFNEKISLMNKILFSCCFVFTGIIASAQLFPNSVDPTGFAWPMDDTDPTVHKWEDNDANDAYVFSNPNSTRLTVTVNKIGGEEWDAFDLRCHDYGNTGTQAFIDINTNPKVWLKIDGTSGDSLRVSLKDGAGYAYRDGYNAIVKLTSSSLAWVEVDYTGMFTSTEIDSILTLSITYQPGGTYSGTIEIDSVLVGMDPSDFATTGVAEDIAAISNAVLSPNPASQVVVVNYGQVDASVEVIITDALGNIKQQVTGGSTSVSIDVSSYASGLYFVSVFVDNKRAVIKKLVVE